MSEKKKSKNENLKKAKKEKNDEFYTQMNDIQNELNHEGYQKAFEGKVIYCNCDDPEGSNFWKYFKLRYNALKLKGLISTHYESKKDKSSYVLRYDGKNIIRTELVGNGDFRSDECIALLQEADIVATNPPFSLFREYVAQLIEYNKKFIIIGNQNAITYKEFFPLLKNNKIWLGFATNKTLEFTVPDNYISDKTDIQGNKIVKVPAISWFTNIDIDKRHEELHLTARYNAEDYPKYDNYDAINVDKVSEIPRDYFGIMGVPITFMDKYNPEQFEILGITQRNDDPYKIKRYTTDEYKNANDLNARAVIIQKDGMPKTTYARILIKRKSEETE